MEDDSPSLPVPSDVAALLRRHGIRVGAVNTVADLGSRVAGATRRTGVEWAAMVDATTGSQLGDLIAGSRSTVDIRTHYAAMTPRHQYVQIHTHPNSSAPGRNDVAVLLGRRNMRAVVVVGADGTWYVLSKPPHGPHLDIATVVERWLAVRDELDRVYVPLVGSGALPAKAAWRRQTHEMWLRIAPGLKLRYDRAEPEQTEPWDASVHR